MSSFLDIWEDMSPGIRLAFAATVIVFIALIATAFLWLGQKEYAPLFAELEARDAARVVSELERLKIDYQLGQSGTQVSVPAEQVHRVRLQLMESGVPLSGGVGFEIFNNSDFGMTEFSQQVNYKRALEGELTRTIMSLKAVKYARVHLVMPERGLFQNADELPSASVVVFYKDSPIGEPLRLNAQQVRGIQRLIAASVPKLSPELVTVTDQNGVTLTSAASGGNGAAVIPARLEQKQALENYLSDKLNTILNHSFGEGRAVATVDVELDFSKTVVTKENVLAPTDGTANIVRKRETRQDASETSSEVGRMTTDVEYRLGHVTEKTIETPGQIKRLNVAITVPDDIPPAEMDEIKRLASASVGLDSGRGDSIAVYRFQPPLPLTTDEATPAQEVLETPVLRGKVDEMPEAIVLRSHLTTPWLIAVLVSASLLLLGIVLLAIKTRKPLKIQATPRLSEVEREAVLLRIRSWLDNSDGSADTWNTTK